MCAVADVNTAGRAWSMYEMEISIPAHNSLFYGRNRYAVEYGEAGRLR